jgi:hypothetical protein
MISVSVGAWVSMGAGEESGLDISGMVPLPLKGIELRIDGQAALLAASQERRDHLFGTQYGVKSLSVGLVEGEATLPA